MPVFYQDLDFERQWLLRMGDGAAANGVNILYCMSYYRHMLQSVEIENVVSLRASGDYQPGNEQWQIGLTSTWIFAVGLSPYKVKWFHAAIVDNFTRTHFGRQQVSLVVLTDKRLKLTLSWKRQWPLCQRESLE